MTEPEPSPEEAFWQFSIAFYALPSVAPALIALQDRDGLDVNLILFALWLGMSGRGIIEGPALAAAERAIGPLRAEITGPLRALRRNLKLHLDFDIQCLRERVKALELDGEKLVQNRLARLAGPADSDIPAEDRRAAAVVNLGTYLDPRGARSAEAAVIRNALASFGQAPLPFPAPQSPGQARGGEG